MILYDYIKSPNIAELEIKGDLDLDEIASLVIEEYDLDEESREDWKENNEAGLKLAQQIKDGRTFAGERVSDVKYPTIASAAIQYAARALPAIVKDGEVVKQKPIGQDPEGRKAARGRRVSQFMNWQFMEDIDNWEEDVDKLLFLHSILGNYYKKTYYDPISKKVCIDRVSPEDLVMYYDSASFDKTPRKTHILYMTHNEYIENVRSGAFLDVEEIVKPHRQDDNGCHTFLEQHRTLDLDGDGYEEPYVVTVHQETQKVVRIYARYEENGIIINDNEEVVRIEPVEYFTEYMFMPSFDGGVYGMGFGILLGPINDSINTLFNQLIDAGSKANSQSGFIGKGVRLRRGGESGPLRFKRGEWKQIQTTGDDLRKSIFPLPLREPSSVLFQLLGFLTQASKELSSQSELLSGNQQQHNVPATSTLALIEQGLQVFSGIYKRVYRGLRKEFQKVHRLDAKYLDEEKYLNVVDDPEANLADFVQTDYDITPVSTAAAVTGTQKYLKAQALLQMAGRGLDEMEINRFYMEALEIPNIDRFIPKQQPPDPMLEIKMREIAVKEQEIQLRAAEVRIKDAEVSAKIREMREKAVKLRADAMKSIADAEAAEDGVQLGEYEDRLVSLLEQIFELEQMEEQRKRAINVGVNNSGGMVAPQSQPNMGEVPPMS